MYNFIPVITCNVLYCITINFVLLRPAEMHALTNKENVMSQNTVYAIA